MLIVTTDTLKNKKYEEVCMVKGIYDSSSSIDECLEDLISQAESRGCNAIIGLRFAVSNSDLVISGTAIKYIL